MSNDLGHPTTTTWDVVVVGSGISGLSTAIAAADAGASVLVLEKCDVLGGSTRLSVGSFSAAGTRMQARARVYDNPGDFDRDLAVINGELDRRDNPVLRRLLVENSAPAFEWLCSFGLQFFGPTVEGSFSHPRMHNVVPNPRSYITVLARQARRRDVCIRTGVRVRELTTDACGRVTGVRADRAYEARNAVVLATGDYSASSELRAKYISSDAADLPAINPNNTGDGFNMAFAVGATCANMDRSLQELRFPASRASRLMSSLPFLRPAAWAIRTALTRLPQPVVARALRTMLTGRLSPSAQLYAEGAILVDSSGQRFCDENDTAASAIALVRRRPPAHAYAVFDASVARRFSAWPNFLSTFPGIAYAYLDDYRRLRPDLSHVARTVPELAGAIGVPPRQLDNSVRTWNTAVVERIDPVFGRRPPADGLTRPPFIALGPLLPAITLTEGGLVVDTRCRVLDQSGTPIAGLWAVGATGQGGMILKGHGLHIAWGAVSRPDRGLGGGRHQPEPEPATRVMSAIDQLWQEHLDTQTNQRARGIAYWSDSEILTEILEAAELRHDLAPAILAEITHNPAAARDDQKQAVADRLRQLAVDALDRATRAWSTPRRPWSTRGSTQSWRRLLPTPETTSPVHWLRQR